MSSAAPERGSHPWTGIEGGAKIAEAFQRDPKRRAATTRAPTVVFMVFFFFASFLRICTALGTACVQEGWGRRGRGVAVPREGEAKSMGHEMLPFETRPSPVSAMARLPCRTGRTGKPHGAPPHRAAARR